MGDSSNKLPNICVNNYTVLHQNFTIRYRKINLHAQMDPPFLPLKVVSNRNDAFYKVNLAGKKQFLECKTLFCMINERMYHSALDVIN